LLVDVRLLDFGFYYCSSFIIVVNA